MNKEKHYSKAAPLGPAKFVPQLLGGLAGGVGGYLKARKSARAAGEKLSFKDALMPVLMGAGKGAMNPLSGAISLGTQGVGNIIQDRQLAAAETDANADIAAQNASINANPVFDPLAAAAMRGLYKT